jgi:hypothetical protein
VTPTPRTWTVDELIAWKERRGTIAPPFGADERSLAQAVAAAWYFWAALTQLPTRAPRASHAFATMYMGAHRVIERREGSW